MRRTTQISDYQSGLFPIFGSNIRGLGPAGFATAMHLFGVSFPLSTAKIARLGQGISDWQRSTPAVHWH
jgi:hypothetical protein